MSIIETQIAAYEFNRTRTLAILTEIEQLPRPADALAWRPGPGRAHIGWQLLHIGLTEEIFATERLAPSKTGKWSELWPRFRGGSKPDDDVPPAATIRAILDESRGHLLDTVRSYSDARLGEIPAVWADKKWTIGTVLHIIGWHEPHHQGQAHATLNGYKAATK